MNQRQLYILMILLMALVLIQYRSARNFREQGGNGVQTGTRTEYEFGKNYPALKNANAQYKIGLALSGGGVKAFCHAGVLKALEEKGIRPDVISGVSAGGVVAALYADGYSPDSILSMFRKQSFFNYYRFSFPDGGLLSLRGFKEFLDTTLHAKTFEELSIPLKIIATDFDSGRTVVFEKGDLVDALVASCSVPMLFPPYKINGVNYVDGGVLQNLPASEIRNDCKVLIGVNCGPINADSYSKSIPVIAVRSYKFIYRSNASYDKSLCDILIEPLEIGEYNSANVFLIKDIFNIGYKETSKLLEKEKFRRMLQIKN